MPRPQIDQELADTVEQIHFRVRGEKPNGLNEAIETVVAVAAKSAQDSSENTRPLQDWYLGKNVEKIYKQLISSEESGRPVDFKERTSGRGQRNESTQEPLDSTLELAQGDTLDSVAVFKAVLSDEGKVEIPTVEREFHSLESGDFLQIIARPLIETEE